MIMGLSSISLRVVACDSSIRVVTVRRALLFFASSREPPLSAARRISASSDVLQAPRFDPSLPPNHPPPLRVQNSTKVRLDALVVGVAPHPGLAGLQGAHGGMAGGVVVLRGVLVLRRVTAAHVAAGEAEAEVYPAVADLQALLASVRRVGLAVELLSGDGFEVFAGHGAIVVQKLAPM